MKILHIGLFSHFTENMTYQDNQLSEQNIQDGHEVYFISDDLEYKNGILVKSIDNNKKLKNNMTLYRKRMGIKGTEIFCRKLGITKNLLQDIIKIKPDVIFYHGLIGVALNTVIKYKKYYNKNIKIYADCHADFNNSAQGIISKFILHKLINKYIITKNIKYLEKIYYISYDVKDFLKEIYNIPESKMEFYPLGGLILTEEERNKKRIKIRNLLNIGNDDILFIHSGKMNKEKKTLELLKQFLQIKDSKFRLILIGSINQEIESFFKTIEDKRIKFLGWKNNEELIDYLCAGDVYLQPGSQSATMQNAMCNENAIVLFPHKSHEPYLKENGYFVKDEKEIYEVLKNISENKNQLEKMKKESLKIAINILDYKKLAQRIYRNS